MNYTVYKHTTPCGKVYIGITYQEPEKRWDNGRGYIKNKYFWRAILKYGWDSISHEVLFANLTKEDACQKEIELIAFYKSNEKEYGYNLDNGGLYAGKHSDKTKQKISKTLTGRKLSNEVKQSISIGHINYFKTHDGTMKGKTHSEETKHKIGLAVSGENNYFYGKDRTGENNPMYGRKQTEESNHKNRMSQPNRKPVVQLDKDTLELIHVYDSAKQAALAVGGSHGNICRSCKETHRVTKGFKWMYYSEYIKQKDAA